MILARNSCIMRDQELSEDHRASDTENATSAIGQRNTTEGACLSPHPGWHSPGFT